jgi:hypothetical protein
MHADIRAHFQALADAVQTTTLPAERKGVVARSVERLAGLYTQFRERHESRYFDEITCQIQWLLNDLEGCPEARKLDATFRERLQFLHEELGLPKLALKTSPAQVSPKNTRKK